MLGPLYDSRASRPGFALVLRSFGLCYGDASNVLPRCCQLCAGDSVPLT